uniref:F-box domain-containing protein n=1 Tax=Tetraselmis sp. GSL018 TaxID=582737 RepID=A0A061RX94_9CHLO|mmetsp:Transcript_5667/g.13761  ORF Transcript_5667/g.13761 Transcript_5667/m.13761 type:complete len:536 (-) Transcript_5667:37-1644(-)|eukprot:CAMPEP_0177606740 /NCGR_PEP_ID=MMETSP0419_2-20121207/17483_1 /TAXON_ID=582737 /ORGANISM="Tetraselmis sp., Strain GSL018" /LENGTH=535 /DNA_ID=CAMNT_0019101151 /DNA_START=502 /DNA_END=2109 /DNA_ORIENTATION=-
MADRNTRPKQVTELSLELVEKIKEKLTREDRALLRATCKFFRDAIPAPTVPRRAFDIAFRTEHDEDEKIAPSVRAALKDRPELLRYFRRVPITIPPLFRNIARARIRAQRNDADVHPETDSQIGGLRNPGIAEMIYSNKAHPEVSLLARELMAIKGANFPFWRPIPTGAAVRACMMAGDLRKAVSALNHGDASPMGLIHDPNYVENREVRLQFCRVLTPIQPRFVGDEAFAAAEQECEPNLERWGNPVEFLRMAVMLQNEGDSPGFEALGGSPVWPLWAPLVSRFAEMVPRYAVTIYQQVARGALRRGMPQDAANVALLGQNIQRGHDTVREIALKAITGIEPDGGVSQEDLASFLEALPERARPVVEEPLEIAGRSPMLAIWAMERGVIPEEFDVFEDYDARADTGRFIQALRKALEVIPTTSRGGRRYLVKYALDDAMEQYLIARRFRDVRELIVFARESGTGRPDIFGELKGTLELILDWREFLGHYGGDLLINTREIEASICDTTIQMRTKFGDFNAHDLSLLERMFEIGV